MSHDFCIECHCGQSSGDVNHGRDELIKAVQNAHSLWLFSKTPYWNIASWDSPADGYVPFIACHFEHGGFTVQGEYSNDVPELVVPTMEVAQYREIHLRWAIQRAETVSECLRKALLRAKESLIR